MTDHRRAGRARPTTTAVEARLLPELLPRLERLAEDAWVLAQRAPALGADPALVAEAGRLLAAVRRLLCREPGHRLLPRSFPPGIRLHALALSLRQLQTAADRFVARRNPGPGTAEEIEAASRLTALLLRDMAGSLAARRNLALPADLRGARGKGRRAVPPP